MVKKTHKWSDRVKEVELPLFSGYNFVRLVLSSPERLRVLKAHGVAGFVGINGSGIAIPESQIQDVRTVLASKVPFEEQCLLDIYYIENWSPWLDLQIILLTFVRWRSASAY